MSSSSSSSHSSTANECDPNPNSVPSRGPQILVTVGSTSFPRLIRYILSPRFTRHLPRDTTLQVQYGRSSLLEILTSSSFLSSSGDDSNTHSNKSRYGKGQREGIAQIDPSSALYPSPGLRNDPQHGYTWKGSHHCQSEALDPGFVGDLIGWKVVGRGGGLDSFTKDEERTTTVVSNPHTLTFTLDAEDDAAPSSSGGTRRNVTLHLFDFTSAETLEMYMRECDVVISHAGSGSLLECLRGSGSGGGAEGESSTPRPTPTRTPTTSKKKMILVPNTTLLDNHQVELADAIDLGKWAWKATVDADAKGYTAKARARGDKDSDYQGKTSESLENVLRRVLNGGHQDNDDDDDDTRPVPFPPSQPQRFRDIVDDLLSS